VTCWDCHVSGRWWPPVSRHVGCAVVHGALGAPALHPCAVCQDPGGDPGARSYPGFSSLWGGASWEGTAGLPLPPPVISDPESQEGDWGLRGGRVGCMRDEG